MVRALLCLFAAACLALAPGLSAAEALSPSAKTLEALPQLPARPTIPDRKPNVAWEDMSAVTLVSLPFTAFWALLGALAVGGFQQGRFPPELDTPLLTGAAAVAAGASLSIGLVSVSWGGSSKPAKADD
jgi:hypothetical protein